MWIQNLQQYIMFHLCMIFFWRNFIQVIGLGANHSFIQSQRLFIQGGPQRRGGTNGGCSFSKKWKKKEKSISKMTSILDLGHDLNQEEHFHIIHSKLQLSLLPETQWSWEVSPAFCKHGWHFDPPHTARDEKNIRLNHQSLHQRWRSTPGRLPGKGSQSMCPNCDDLLTVLHTWLLLLCKGLFSPAKGFYRHGSSKDDSLYPVYVTWYFADMEAWCWFCFGWRYLSVWDLSWACVAVLSWSGHIRHYTAEGLHPLKDVRGCLLHGLQVYLSKVAPMAGKCDRLVCGAFTVYHNALLSWYLLSKS